MTEYILFKNQQGGLALLVLKWVDFIKMKDEGYKEVVRGGWKECRKEMDSYLN